MKIAWVSTEDKIYKPKPHEYNEDTSYCS